MRRGAVPGTPRLTRRAVLAGGVFLGAAQSGTAQAQAVEKPSIVLASGGRTLFSYLPMNVADALGYFKDEGLSVEIPEFDGGSRVTQALVGGSADFANTVFDQTIFLQTRFQYVRGVVAQTDYAYYVLMLPTDRAGRYKSGADLKGLKIGVTAPGSGSHVFVQLILAKAGLSTRDVSIIQVGGGVGSVAAMEHGEIDAISSLDPVISQLELIGKYRAVVDSRTATGMKEVYGGSYLGACLLARQSFIEQNPRTVQAVVNSQVRALRWLAKATPAEIMSALPANRMSADRELYAKSLAKALEGISKDGLMGDEAARNVLASLTQFDKMVAQSKDIDLAKTRTNAFVQTALAKFG